MNFDYIVYNGGYDLWRFFLNNGYPISIEVIQDLIIEGGYKVKIENIYKTDCFRITIDFCILWCKENIGKRSSCNAENEGKI